MPWVKGPPPKSGPAKVRLGETFVSEQDFSEANISRLASLHRERFVSVEHWIDEPPAVLDVEAAFHFWSDKRFAFAPAHAAILEEAFRAGWAAKPGLVWRDGPPTQPGLYALAYASGCTTVSRQDGTIPFTCVRHIGPLPEPQEK
jgi:hypothetical protein